MDEQITAIKTIVDSAERIVIIQADNPDGDSLGSALALESILGDLGKSTFLYCAVDIPSYLQYLPGWDLVQHDLPSQFDASIIVDASTMTLLERLENSGTQGWLASKPCIVLDHHEKVEKVIPFATVIINDFKRSSTGELIYRLSQQLDWQISMTAMECIMTAILGDTQGLTNQLASADTYAVMTEMVAAGVDRPKLEEMRRESSKMPPQIFKYKAKLIERTELTSDGKIASVMIPQNEINTYSPLYNPAPLVQGDMLQTLGVQIAIVFKHYNDGRTTGAIRCNPGFGVGADLAVYMGGGGHAFASGFKVTDGRSFDEVKTACLNRAAELLGEVEGKTDATVQYAYQTD